MSSFLFSSKSASGAPVTTLVPRSKKQIMKEAAENDAMLQEEFETRSADEEARLASSFGKHQEQRLKALEKFETTFREESSSLRARSDEKIRLLHDKYTGVQFPETVILVIYCHGLIQDPFQVPCRVVRHLAADLCSSNFSTPQKKRRHRDLVLTPKNYGKRLQAILNYLFRFDHTRRTPMEVILGSEARYEDYKVDRHYTKSKTFEQMQPMFDKLLQYDSENDVVAVRGVDNDFLFEFAADDYNDGKLSEFLFFLAEKGVALVLLYDESCNRSTSNNELFGGSKKGKKRRTRKRFHSFIPAKVRPRVGTRKVRAIVR